MESITIKVSYTDQGGYMYDVWKGDQVSEDAPQDSDEGGQCTTTLENALDMALDAAHSVEFRDRAGLIECPGCNELIHGGPALSRYGHGYLTTDCGEREAFEGDFIGNR